MKRPGSLEARSLLIDVIVSTGRGKEGFKAVLKEISVLQAKLSSSAPSQIHNLTSTTG